MQNSKNTTIHKPNITNKGWKKLQDATQRYKEIHPENEDSVEELPDIMDVILQNMNSGTMLRYEEKPITFNKPQSLVKSLKVTVSSIERENMQALHKLHTLIRD